MASRSKITTAKIPRKPRPRPRPRPNMRDWPSVSERVLTSRSRACSVAQRRAEGDFIVQTPILTTLALSSLALYSVDSSAFRATNSRSLLYSLSPSVVVLNESPLQSSYPRLPSPNLSRGGRDKDERASGRRNYSPQFPMNGAKFSWPTTATTPTPTM